LVPDEEKMKTNEKSSSICHKPPYKYTVFKIEYMTSKLMLVPKQQLLRCTTKSRRLAQCSGTPLFWRHNVIAAAATPLSAPAQRKLRYTYLIWPPHSAALALLLQNGAA
jgi:hypothetical protein